MSLSTFLLASSISLLYTIAALAIARLETRVSNLEGELLASDRLFKMLQHQRIDMAVALASSGMSCADAWAVASKQ